MMQVHGYSCKLQMMLSSKIVLLSVLGVLAIVAYTNAECCPCSNSGFCSDNTVCGTYPNFCCAHGNCNIFCCNCDGGCRTGLEAKQDDNATEFLSQIDKDSSGDVDLQEFENFNIKYNMPKNMLIYTIFTLLDENEDGHISAKEFNTANLK